MKFKLKNLDQLSFDSFQIIFIKGLGIIITYLLMLFITNFFPEELVGKFNFSNNILVISGTICLFGANQSIYQLGARIVDCENKGVLKQLYIKYILLSFVIYILILSLTLIIPDGIYQSLFNKENISSLIVKTTSIAFFYFLATLNFEVFRILNKIKSSEFFRSIFRSICFFIGAIIIFFINQKYFLVDVFLFSFFLTSIVTTIVVFRLLKKEKANPNTVSISYKKIIKVSLPMSIGALFLLLMQSIDAFFIIKYKSFSELAFYGIAVKLTFLISIVLTSINTIIAPDIAKYYYQKDFNKLKEIVFKSSKLNFILTIPLLLLLLFFPKTILSFFGENYTNARIALIILSCGHIINSFCGSVGLYLNMTGRQKEIMFLLFVSLIINIVLNFILIPKYGINGAAISSSISLIFWNITGLLFIYFKDKVITFFRY